MLGTIVSFGQAKKYPLLEHFTQASCGPCAVLNPAFFDMYYRNAEKTHLIAYHSWWPGTDPMFDHNESEQTSIIQNYGINSVPSTVINGNAIGSPSNLTEDNMNASLSSPVRVIVTEEDSSTPGERNVHVEVQTVGQVNGQLRLRVVAVEEPIQYNSPPGSNGEREFPYVFRKFLTGAAGAVFAPAAIGESISFDYVMEMHDDWTAENMLAVAYVSRTSGREVLNSGVMGDPQFEIAAEQVSQYQMAEADGNTFEVRFTEMEDVTSTVQINLISDQPDDWTVEMEYDGAVLNSGQEITVPSGISKMQVRVDYQGITGIGQYTIEAIQMNGTISERIPFTLVSPATDLVLTTNSAFGGPNVNVDLAAPVVKGLTDAGNETFLSINEDLYFDLQDEQLLNGVQNVYLNLGWTFPPLTLDWVNTLKPFLQNGGNLMIAGQDIGSEITSNASGTIKLFYIVTMNCGFEENTQSHNVATSDGDSWFGNISDFSLTDVYGAGNHNPDVVQVKQGATGILHFDGDQSKAAGVRLQKDGYKIVYLGFGLEQIEDENVANQLILATHNYFNNIVVSVGNNPLAEQKLHIVGPNPAVDHVWVALPNEMKMNEHLSAVVTNSNGQVVTQTQIDVAAADKILIGLNSLPRGVYVISINDGLYVYASDPIVVFGR